MGRGGGSGQIGILQGGLMSSVAHRMGDGG